MKSVQSVAEIVNIFAATANPLQVVVDKSEQGRGVMGVIDGFTPKGVEKEEDKKNRHGFLRTIHYKL